jgi:DNA-binding winged helix-turn-helix (wHTH) protein
VRHPHDTSQQLLNGSFRGNITDRTENISEILARAVRREQTDFSKLSGTTNLLLEGFWNAENSMLSHDDIWQDVVNKNDGKEYTSESVRQAITRARNEIKLNECPYEIVNVWGKGWKLIDKKSDNV